MNKIVVLLIFVVFAGYSIASLFVEIPKVFNNYFYGAISILAVYFAIFHLDIGRGIKDRLEENKSKIEAQKRQNNK